ncbi:MAG: DEAD/DEAH box helicase family protein [Candidatus Didemnitutus sp.]|nr:DEAD/DEAH box helicase family protein [Candidatus Didemnitutus sp.]
MNLAGFSSPVASWPDFTQRVSGLEVQARGRPFELVVQHYLRSDPAYRTKLRHVWLLSDVPDAIHKQLGLPHLDQGIDLIAETHTGEFWAIQAKYRTDTEAALTHRELATFTSLAFTVCRDISYGLVCTTTSRIPGILTGLPNLGDLTNDVWSGLGPEFFSSLQETIATGSLPARPKARVPQPHQERAIASAIVHYHDKGETRGKLISPCGSGKSLTACWIAQKLEAKRVLIAVPSIALIRQTLETWMHEALARDEPADWLCVCSDHDAAKTEKAELVAHVHELGIPCDTHPEALARHLSALRGQSGQIVVITTYQSSPVLAAAAKAAGFSFDFAVLDEAHRTTGQKAKSFAHLLFDEKIPLPRRLFMTATERRFQGSSDDVVSMDDPALYGGTFELLSFKAAIAATPPILSDYRILTIGVRESEVARLVEANRWLDLGTEGLDGVTAQALASLVALRRATVEHGVQHTVSFHSSIARAKQFRDLCARLNAALPAEKPISSHHVNGGMGSAARQRELTSFLATAPSLVTNARCLTEGVDVPSIDCVFFADPKGSTIEIVQAAGRALRLDPSSGKTMGYILLPLVVKDGVTLEAIAESSAFKFVLFVLRALATHDERIIEWFRATAEGRTPEVSRLVTFDFGRIIMPLGVSAADFARQIEVQCWKSVAKLAYRSYGGASAFASERLVKSQKQWRRLITALGDSWPADVPKNPDKSYLNRGWTTWGAFFGTGAIGTKQKQFRPFADARSFTRSLGLKSSDEWYPYCSGQLAGKLPLPTDIPATPERCKAYAGQWSGWADWLGYEDIRTPWRPFEEAREFARSLKIPGQQHWKAYCRGERPNLPAKPDDIPASPWKAYANSGWVSWGDWLGHGMIGTTVRNYLSFTKAREIARSLGLTSRRAWIALANDAHALPPRIPRQPDRTYATKGWVGWSDWLGAEIPETKRTRKPREFRNYESARAFVHALHLTGSLEWPRYLKGDFPDKPPLPPDIPKSPRNVYRGLWLGWGDWLGTGNIAPSDHTFRSFKSACLFVRGLGFKTGKEWFAWSKISGNRPRDIPSNPAAYYKDKGWTNWPDFLQSPSAI